MTYGSSQTRGQIGAVAAVYTTDTQQGIQAASATYTTALGNTRSLTHWVRPGIKPGSSWMPVRFVSAEPQWKLPGANILTKTLAW